MFNNNKKFNLNQNNHKSIKPLMKEIDKEEVQLIEEKNSGKIEKYENFQLKNQNSSTVSSYCNKFLDDFVKVFVFSNPSKLKLSWHQCTSILLIGSGIAYVNSSNSLSSKIFPSQSNLKLAFNLAISIGSVTAYGIASSWAMSRVLQKIHKLTYSEIQYISKYKSSYIKIFCSFLLSCITVVPDFYIAYKYNKKDLFKIIYILLGAAAQRAFGFYTLITSKSLVMKIFKETYLNIEKSQLQEELISILKYSYKNPLEFKKKLTNSLNNELCVRLLIEIFYDEIEPIKTSNFSRGKKIVIISISTIATSLAFVSNSYVSYKGLSLILPKFLSIIFSPILSLPLLGLGLYTTSEMTNNIYDGLFNIFTCNGEKFNKKQILFSIISSIFGFCYGLVDAYIAYDIFSESATPFKEMAYLIFFVIFSLDFFFETFSFYDFLTILIDILENLIYYHDIQIYHYREAISRLATMAEYSSSDSSYYENSISSSVSFFKPILIINDNNQENLNESDDLNILATDSSGKKP